MSVPIETMLDLARATLDRDALTIAVNYKFAAIVDSATSEVLMSCHDTTLEYATIRTADDALEALWQALLVTATMRLRERDRT
jgi:hypothetical protein